MIKHNFYRTIYFKVITVLCLICSVWAGSVWGADDTDTMLMFVGEDIAAVTVASRMPESPSDAPAVVNVVTRDTMEKYGFKTIAQLLSFEPGFYISQASRGSIPYLRGLRESILFLYDGIPMPSGGTKNIHPIDYELSLENIKQVEIIRGPGSVLWGSDAFAGIVNIVPLDAEKAPGIITDFSMDSLGKKSAFISYGKKSKNLSTFISLRAGRQKYHDEKYNVYFFNENSAIETEEKKIDDSEYFELTANGRINDWLSFTSRFSDFTKEYTVESYTVETGSKVKWKGVRKTPVSFISLSGSRSIGKSHVKLSAYYQNLSFFQQDMNSEYQENLDQYYTELLWDRRFFEKGLLTTGVSYKDSKISGALAKGEFEPEYIITPPSFSPQIIEQTDYNTQVTSIFSQYRHHIDDVQLWAGIRLDKNAEYSTYTSWNTGVNWKAPLDFRLKAQFGTAYRTPHSQQFFSGAIEQTDEIDTYSLQIKRNFADHFKFDLTMFYNSISGYVSPDPYAGVSEPLSQDIYGAEMSVSASFPLMDFYLDMSRISSGGDDYMFSVEDYSLVNDDGSVTIFYDTWHEPFDTAPKFMVKSGATYHVNKNTDISINAQYIDEIEYTWSKGTIRGKYSDYWLADLTVKVNDFIVPGLKFTCGVSNIFDKEYFNAGFYGPAPGPGRTFFVRWSQNW